MSQHLHHHPRPTPHHQHHHLTATTGTPTSDPGLRKPHRPRNRTRPTPRKHHARMPPHRSDTPHPTSTHLRWIEDQYVAATDSDNSFPDLASAVPLQKLTKSADRAAVLNRLAQPTMCALVRARVGSGRRWHLSCRVPPFKASIGRTMGAIVPIGRRWTGQRKARC